MKKYMLFALMINLSSTTFCRFTSLKRLLLKNPRGGISLVPSQKNPKAYVVYFKRFYKKDLKSSDYTNISTAQQRVIQIKHDNLSFEERQFASADAGSYLIIASGATCLPYKSRQSAIIVEKPVYKKRIQFVSKKAVDTLIKMVSKS